MEKILFLNEKDRNVGHDFEHSDYRYKTAKPVTATKSKRDEDGFIAPYVMFRPVRELGLLCELLGETPVRRSADLKMNLDSLMKEAYEHMIEQLMCNVRLQEVRCQLHFAMEDRAWERYSRLSEKGQQTTMPQVTLEEHRRMILNAITWKYDWIQQNKKQCFQFAEAVIESLKNGVTKNLGKSQSMGPFIKYAVGLPEPNRNLIDEMYEAAWYIIQIYRYRADPERVPEPWYDKKETDNGEC